MVAKDRTRRGAFQNCFVRRPAIESRHQSFGHSLAITPKAHCSFLLWTQEQKSYIAVQTL